MPDDRFAEIAKKYSSIFAIISPPRCSSTALARMFWEQPSVRYYSHEPFETTYYQGAPVEEAADKLRDPLDLCEVYKADTGGRGLVIKEMVYQVGPHFDRLAALATAPLIFLMRDPRLNISSRISKKIEGGASARFPEIETGWELLAALVARCQEIHRPHLILDASDFRDHPTRIFPRLFQRLGLPFSPEMLRWRSGAHIDLDNLGGPHRHLYRRVLLSRRLEPATEPIPTVDALTQDPALRQHIRRCMALYRALLDAPARIRPEPPGPSAAEAERSRSQAPREEI